MAEYKINKRYCPKSPLEQNSKNCYGQDLLIGVKITRGNFKVK